MTSPGKWLLVSGAVHLLAVAGMAMLCASVQKPATVIDLSQLGHIWQEPAARQAGGNARQETAPPAPPQEPAAVAPPPRKQKPVVPKRSMAKSVKAGAQPVAAADAPGGNATAGAAAGGPAGAGQGRAGAGGPSGGGGQGVYRGRYFGYITGLVLKAAVYPLQARRMGWQGTVKISFVIQKNGAITEAVVLESSGHPVLDGSALSALKKIGPLPAPPDRVEIRLPVVFRLTGSGGP